MLQHPRTQALLALCVAISQRTNRTRTPQIIVCYSVRIEKEGGIFLLITGNKALNAKQNVYAVMTSSTFLSPH